MSRYRYHITPLDNLDAILTQGLIPLIGARSLCLDEPFPAIYLFPDLGALEDALMGWMNDCFDEDQPLALLAVDTQGMSEFSSDMIGFETMLFEQVQAEKIMVISRDVASEIDLSAKVHSTLFPSGYAASELNLSM